MKYVYLDHKGNEFSITDEAYVIVETIIKANLLCRFCQRPYTFDRPMVARNKCLSCFFTSHAQAGLRYTGEHYAAPYGETYLFLDMDGYVYLSYDSSEDGNNLYKSVYDTMLYWGFTPFQG